MIGASPVPELTVEQVRDAIYAASREGFDLAKCGVNESLLTDELNEVLRQAAGAGGGADAGHSQQAPVREDSHSGDKPSARVPSVSASLGPDIDANGVSRNPDLLVPMDVVEVHPYSARAANGLNYDMRWYGETTIFEQAKAEGQPVIVTVTRQR